MPPLTGLCHLWAEGYKYIAPTALVPFANGRYKPVARLCWKPKPTGFSDFVPAETDAEAIDITGPAWLSRRQKKNNHPFPDNRW